MWSDSSPAGYGCPRQTSPVPPDATLEFGFWTEELALVQGAERFLVKSDPIDAEAVARAVLAGTATVVLKLANGASGRECPCRRTPARPDDRMSISDPDSPVAQTAVRSHCTAVTVTRNVASCERRAL